MSVGGELAQNGNLIGVGPMSLETVDVNDEDDGPRNLTPADVRAIVRELERAMTKRFYENLGRGLFGLLLTAAAAALLFLAAWGAKLDAKIGGAA